MFKFPLFCFNKINLSHLSSDIGGCWICQSFTTSDAIIGMLATCSDKKISGAGSRPLYPRLPSAVEGIIWKSCGPDRSCSCFRPYTCGSLLRLLIAFFQIPLHSNYFLYYVFLLEVSVVELWYLTRHCMSFFWRALSRLFERQY